MNKILESSPYPPGSSLRNLAHMKAKSTQIARFIPEVELKKQISAPSYLLSLKVNEAPPFKKPEKETSPKLLLKADAIMTDEEAVEMVAAFDSDRENGLNKFFG